MKKLLLKLRIYREIFNFKRILKNMLKEYYDVCTYEMFDPDNNDTHKYYMDNANYELQEVYEIIRDLNRDLAYVNKRY